MKAGILVGKFTILTHFLAFTTIEQHILVSPSLPVAYELSVTIVSSWLEPAMIGYFHEKNHNFLV